MSQVPLSLEQTPPPIVPLTYMLTAPIFAIFASLVIFINPEAMQNRWSPAALSVTHLLVLGFSVMVMFGAIQQLLPVLAGVRFKRTVLISSCLYLGLCLGVMCLCVGLLLSNSMLLKVAVFTLLLTVVSFFILIMSGLVRSEANPRSIQGIQFALIAFIISVALGLYLGAAHAFHEVSLERVYTSIHLTWGLLGWIGLLIVSVSYQVVPMFQITPKYPDVAVRWLVPVIFTALLAWSSLKLLGASVWLWSAAELVISVGFLLFCIITLNLQYKRRRKLPDVTLDYFRLGLSSLIFAVVVWWLPESILAEWLDGNILMGILLIVGFTMAIISGMLYKIIPFLIWLHLTNKIEMSTRWQRRLPNMKEIIPDKHSRWQFRLHSVALLLLLASLSQVEWIIQFAALVLMLSNLYLSRNLVSAVMLYHRVITEPAPISGDASHGQ